MFEPAMVHQALTDMFGRFVFTSHLERHRFEQNMLTQVIECVLCLIDLYLHTSWIKYDLTLITWNRELDVLESTLITWNRELDVFESTLITWNRELDVFESTLITWNREWNVYSWSNIIRAYLKGNEVNRRKCVSKKSYLYCINPNDELGYQVQNELPADIEVCRTDTPRRIHHKH